MHPIERLRYVARSPHLDAGTAALEAAPGLAAVAGEAQGLVVACRRLIERHPSAGPLWWLCARALVAPDPRTTLQESAIELELDSSHEVAFDEAPDETVVVEARAAGPHGFLADLRTADLVNDMAGAGMKVWVVVGVGRPLPGAMWDAARAMSAESGSAELLSWSAASQVVGPDGLESPADAYRRVTCPVVPELLWRSPGGQSP